METATISKYLLSMSARKSVIPQTGKLFKKKYERHLHTSISQHASDKSECTVASGVLIASRVFPLRLYATFPLQDTRAFAAYSSLTFLAGGPAAAWNIQPESTERRLTCGLERTYAGVGCGSAIATNIAFATQIIPNSNVSPQFWVSFFTFHWGLGGDKFPLLLCSFQSLATPNLRPAAVNRAAFFPGPYEHGLTMTAFGQNLFMLLKHRELPKVFYPMLGSCQGLLRSCSSSCFQQSGPPPLGFRLVGVRLHSYSYSRTPTPSFIKASFAA